MGGQKISCSGCSILDEAASLCNKREVFVRPNKGRYCHDFIDKTKITKPKKEIPKSAKEETPIEEMPVETKLEISPTKEIKRVSLIRRLLNWLIRRVKCLLKLK